MSQVNIEVQFINPFVSASFSVLSTMLGLTPEKGALALCADSSTHQQVNVAIGVTGDVTGYIIFGMSLQTCLKMASLMVGSPMKMFDPLVASAVAELANMICGHGLMTLAESGCHCDLAPPTVIKGINVEITTAAIPAIAVPLSLEFGDITVTVGLRRRNELR